jgi:hypothetical protein
MQGCPNPMHQVCPETTLSTVVPNVGVVRTKPSGTQNLEIATRFLEKLYATRKYGLWIKHVVLLLIIQVVNIAPTVFCKVT